jgi:hypothetical protein
VEAQRLESTGDCEAEGIPPKAFDNWRTKFKAEPQLPERKLLYRRRGLSPPLSQPLSHPLSHLTYPSSCSGGPIVPRPREGHRRRFSEADIPGEKMRRSRAPSIAPGAFFVAQSWADCITNMAGFNLRQGQPFHGTRLHHHYARA